MITPIRYIGSKNRLAQTIISLLPVHSCYVEVCGGSGAVLFTKPYSEVEVYNDINNHLVTMFQVIRNQPDEFLYRLQWVMYSRKEWMDALTKMRANVFIDTVDHAINTMILYGQSMAGVATMKRGGWGYALSSNKALDFFNRAAGIKPLAERLQNVQIENLDFQSLIPKYDDEKTVFYIDPPYIGDTRAEPSSYVNEFTDADHIALVDLLLSLKGQFILSGYDNPIYNRLNIFDRIDIPMTSGARADGKHVDRVEVIWHKAHARQLAFPLT